MNPRGQDHFKQLQRLMAIANSSARTVNTEVCFEPAWASGIQAHARSKAELKLHKRLFFNNYEA